MSWLRAKPPVRRRSRSPRYDQATTRPQFLLQRTTPISTTIIASTLIAGLALGSFGEIDGHTIDTPGRYDNPLDPLAELGMAKRDLMWTDRYTSTISASSRDVAPDPDSVDHTGAGSERSSKGAMNRTLLRGVHAS
jgi:hypothetical protein